MKLRQAIKKADEMPLQGEVPERVEFKPQVMPGDLLLPLLMASSSRRRIRFATAGEMVDSAAETVLRREGYKSKSRCLKCKRRLVGPEKNRCHCNDKVTDEAQGSKGEFT